MLDIDMEGTSFPRGFKHHLEYDAVTERISVATSRPGP